MSKVGFDFSRHVVNRTALLYSDQHIQWLWDAKWNAAQGRFRFEINGYFILIKLLNANVILCNVCLEKGDNKTKIEALKKVIHMIANGERLPGLLMIIIRFVLPLHDHTIKKLLLIFWEIVPKTTADGKLLQEMILVCDAYRKVIVI